jgi:hypothetical protein
MFDIPVEKSFNELTFATSPTVSTGSITTLGLNYSKIGPLIHGQYIFATTVGTLGTQALLFTLPISSFYAITFQDSVGTAAPIAFTTAATGNQGMLQVSASVTSAGQYTCRFIGSDSKTLVANSASPSRVLTLNHGKQYTPPLTVNTGTITNIAGHYQYTKYPIKLLTGSFTVSTASNVNYPMGSKTVILESYCTSNTTSAIGTVVSGSIRAEGGITFPIAAAGTNTFLILLRERGR